MNMQKKMYKWTLVYVSIHCAIMVSVMLFGVIWGIYYKEPVQVAVCGFAIAFIGFVLSILVRVNRNLVNSVSFDGDNVILTQNSGKEIIIPWYAVSEVIERFTLIEIRCDKIEIPKTYRMQTRFWPFRKYVPDMDEWKKRLPGCTFRKEFC